MAGKGDIPYAQAATSLGVNEGAARVAVHRLRRRYRELLREEIAQTLSDPADLEEETARAVQGVYGVNFRQRARAINHQLRNYQLHPSPAAMRWRSRSMLASMRSK